MIPAAAQEETSFGSQDMGLPVIQQLLPTADLISEPSRLNLKAK
jgi:hypothetical protein